MNFSTKSLSLFFSALVLLLFSACHSLETEYITPAEIFDHTTFYEWNELYLELDRHAPGFRPGPSARSLGYLGLSAYECSIGGMDDHLSLSPLFPGLEMREPVAGTDYYWPAAVNESYHYLMQRFFFPLEQTDPALFEKIEATYQSLRQRYIADSDAEIVQRSEKLGLDIARAVYDWEKTDEIGHDAFLVPRPNSYTPPTGLGKWEPTGPDFSRALFPYWGQVRTFAIRNADKIALPPIPYSETPGSLYWTQAVEVYTRVKNLKENGPNAYQDQWVAEFWSDDHPDLTFSPAARLVAIANQIVASQKLNHAQCAELYAKLGMALSDASVACWRSKYLYNVQRPIGYINTVLSNDFADAATWTTSMNNPLTGNLGMNPSFPAYPSGHSTFAGAGGKILSSMFEYTSDYPGTYTFTDNCHLNRTEFIGTPRTFASFKDMAIENAYSRIPLGVHFRMDCDEGLRMGELAAQRVLELPWRK